MELGVLFFLAVSGLSAYSAILAGWSSNNKYALLGSLRASAQVISYEVFMGLAIMGVVLLTGSFNLSEIVAPQALGFVLFVIAALVETHRLPFDIPLAETELVAGYHTEYSGLKFGLFYVGEYLGMLLMAGMVVTFYLGGWLGPWLPPWLWFALKVLLVLCFFILLRAALPRPRYDQLMDFGWKWMLPLSILNLAVTGALVLA
jgi:NADH-quinone oxidoreductase subunit H